MKKNLLGGGFGLALAIFALGAGEVPKPEVKNPSNVGSPTGQTVPALDQILQKNVQALGGKAALQKITTRVMKGTMEISGLGTSVALEFKAKAPNKRLMTYEMPNFGTMLDGFNGQVAWGQSPGLGVSEKSGEELARIKRDAILNRELKMKEIYPRLRVLGRQPLGNEAVYVVEAIPAGGKPEKFHFNAQTAMLDRHESEFTNDAGRVVMVTDFKDYREVDGVKLPFTLVINVNAPNSPETIVTIKFTECRHNVALADSIFEKPAGQ